MSIPQNAIKRFLHGLFYPQRAARFIVAHPALYKYIMLPFLINAIVFILAAYWGFNSLTGFIEQYLPQGDAWYWQLLHYFSFLFSLALVGVFIFFTFAVVGNLIAAPFNDILSEKSEMFYTGVVEPESSFSLSRFARETAKLLFEELKKMSVFIGILCCLLPLNLIPGIGVLLFSALSLLVTVFFLVIEYTGYFFSRKLLMFQDQRLFIRKNFMLSAGFGAGLFLLLMLPFLQFFTIPLGVVGATFLCLDTDAAGRQIS